METINALSEYAESIKRLVESVKNDTRVMTCGEAAYMLNKTPQTISRYISQGKLHKATGNGVIGVRASDVYILIAKQQP